ncbi:MAG: LacI family DNA-binding transcriptional regulator [Neorhizobium sp.]|nr:LacI family DNA-binding transcriptional regulator [Neorhizobium sp.]
MKPTVHDIARNAGVSLATVDRVLNGRPGVRPTTRERVETVIASIGYVRDLAAANLAKGRTYRFVFVLPQSNNFFMRELRQEVEGAIVRSGAERVAIRIVQVPPFDAPALAAALDDLRHGSKDEEPAGVAFVAVDAPEVREAVARLARSGIPVVSLVSDLPGSARDHYTGIDNFAAGRTAGSLMGRFLGQDSEAVVAVMAGSMLLRDHRERLQGFEASVGEFYPHIRLLPVIECRDDSPTAERLLTALMLQHPEIAGIYSLGAGNRGLVRSLQGVLTEHRPVVIAHELTAATRSALHEGSVDAVLSQNAAREVRSTIRVLKARADGLSFVEQDERIGIDIFLKDNLP